MREAGQAEWTHLFLNSAENYLRPMLANLLLVVGLVALLAGAYLKFAGDHKAAQPMAAAAAAPATATPLTDEENGLAFEQWVADRFPKRSLHSGTRPMQSAPSDQCS